MDFLSKQKFTNLLIIALVVINVASLSFIWYKQLLSPPAPPPPPAPGRANVNNFLESELHLTPDQQKQFAEIRREHAAKTKAMNQKMEMLRRRILRESFSDKPDTNKINELSEKIAETQKRYEVFLSEHFRKLSSVCIGDQKERLKEIFMSTLTPPPPAPRQDKPRNNPPPPEGPPR